MSTTKSAIRTNLHITFGKCFSFHLLFLLPLGFCVTVFGTVFTSYAVFSMLWFVPVTFPFAATGLMVKFDLYAINVKLFQTSKTGQNCFLFEWWRLKNAKNRPCSISVQKIFASSGIFVIHKTPHHLWTYWQAHQECAQRGAALTSLAEIWEVQRSGYGIRVS